MTVCESAAVETAVTSLEDLNLFVPNEELKETVLYDGDVVEMLSEKDFVAVRKHLYVGPNKTTEFVFIQCRVNGTMKLVSIHSFTLWRKNLKGLLGKTFTVCGSHPCCDFKFL